MPYTLQQVADHLAGRGMPAAIDGDPQLLISAVSTLDDAAPSELSFLANPKYEKQLDSTRAGAVIVSHEVVAPRPMTLVRTAQPYSALMEAIVLIHGHRKHPDWSIHPAAVISPSATIGKNARIGPNVTIDEQVCIGDNVVLYPGCYIGRGSRLGNDVTLYANTVIYDDCVVGNQVSIHSGTVIGEDGLGYAPVGERWNKIPQVGRVIIEDGVEIGANCTIDRATLGTTVIGNGSKFSNLIAIGHGTKIGDNAMFVAQVGVAGSVTVGKHVQMGGQAGVIGHIRIGDNASVAAKSGVASDVEAGEFVLGQPAIRATEAKRILSITQRLPELKQRVKALEVELAELSKKVNGRLN